MASLLSRFVLACTTIFVILCCTCFNEVLQEMKSKQRSRGLALHLSHVPCFLGLLMCSQGARYVPSIHDEEERKVLRLGLLYVPLKTFLLWNLRKRSLNFNLDFKYLHNWVINDVFVNRKQSSRWFRFRWSGSVSLTCNIKCQVSHSFRILRKVNDISFIFL